MEGSPIRKRYDLSLEKKPKPDMSVEDLRCVLQHHWIYGQEIYPTERQRIQSSLLLLIATFTRSRPGGHY